jgi:NADH:ubiquinone oxidoreductase subunit 6 (subunit J)
VLALGILVYIQSEFFAFLILFIYSGAITVLFIFLLQFYNINFESKRDTQKTYSFPIIIKTIIGSCFLLLLTAISFILVLDSNFNENWELLNNVMFIDENLIQNLSVLFLANQMYGNITIIIGCILLIGLVVILCIVESSK